MKCENENCPFGNKTNGMPCADSQLCGYFIPKPERQSEPVEYSYITTESVRYPIKRMKIGRRPGGDNPTRKRMRKKRMKHELKISIIADRLADRIKRRIEKNIIEAI